MVPHSWPATNPQARQFQGAAWVAARLCTIFGLRAVLGSQHSPAREDAPIGSNAPVHSSCNRAGHSQCNLFIMLLLRRLPPFLRGLFRSNCLTLRDLHGIASHGPCIVFLWSWSGCPRIALIANEHWTGPVGFGRFDSRRGESARSPIESPFAKPRQSISIPIPMSISSKNLSTLALHAGQVPDPTTGARAVPI